MMPRPWYKPHALTWLFACALLIAFIVANNTEYTRKVEWQRGVFQKAYGWPSCHTRTLYFEKPDDWREIITEYTKTSGERMYESKITKEEYVFIQKRTDEGERIDIFWLWDICVCAMIVMIATTVFEVVVRKWEPKTPPA